MAEKLNAKKQKKYYFTCFEIGLSFIVVVDSLVSLLTSHNLPLFMAKEEICALFQSGNCRVKPFAKTNRFTANP